MSLRHKFVILAFLLGCVGTVLGLRYLLDEVERNQTTNSANFSELEPGLIMGARVEEPPPGTHATLCLSMEKDAYTTEHYRWQPIPDGVPVPTIDWLREQVKFIDDQRRAGRTVFVHCDAGISRSGMVIAAYYMWREHWSGEKALAVIRTKRQIVNPNQPFMALLAQWEREMSLPLTATTTTAPESPTTATRAK